MHLTAPADTHRTSSADLKVLWYSLGVIGLLALYYATAWRSFHDFQLKIDHCEIPFCDFVEFFYPMGHEIFASHAPVTGYYYSPLFAVVLGIFGALSADVSLLAWVGSIIVTMILMFFLSLKLTDIAVRRQIPVFLLFFLTSFPLVHNFKWGQVSVFLTFLVIFGGVLYEQNHRALSAGALVLAISIKYYPAIFLPYFLFKKDWKFLAWIVVWGVLDVFVLPSLVLGIDHTLDFYRTLAGGVYANEVAGGGPNSQYIVNVFMRGVHALQTHSDALRFALAVAGFGVVYVNLVLILRLAGSMLPRRTAWAFVVGFLTIVFYTATSWPHYLVFFPFCQFYLFREIWGDSFLSTGKRYLLSAMVLVSSFLSSIVLFNLIDDYRVYNGWGTLFWSDCIQLLVTYLLLLPKLPGLWSGKKNVPAPLSEPARLQT